MSRVQEGAGLARQLRVLNPSTLEVVGTAQESTQADIDTAVRAAAAAQAEWRDLGYEGRKRAIEAGASRIRAGVDELARLLTREQGKPLREATVEVTRSADTLSYYANFPEMERSEPRELPGGLVGYVHRLPIGVCAGIVPWNFPLALLANKLAPALLTGNTFVAKPSRTTPLATQRWIELFRGSDLPAGVVELVLGGRDVGMHLLRHPLVMMVSFTGSTKAGKEIMAAAADGLKRLTLELGGNDALIVHHDADLLAATNAIVSSRFFNAGQGCIATKRVYAQASVHDPLIELLRERVSALRVGDGLDPQVNVGPLHSAAQLDSVERLVADAVSRGAIPVVGGARLPEAGPGYFFRPTVLAEVSDGSRLLHDECFGPVLPVFRYQALGEAMQRANATPFGLGSAIWTNDPESIGTAIRGLEAGYTWVNTPATIYDPMPHGGIKESGFGKEKGVEALDEFSFLKSIISPDYQL